MKRSTAWRAVLFAALVMALAVPATAAADVTVSLQGTTLVVTGTDGADTIGINPDGANGVAVVVVGVGGAVFSVDGVGSVVVNTGAGDDTVIGALGLASHPLSIDGGPGNDTLTGGDGADTIHGGDGADRIIPSRGNDTVFGDAGPDVIVWNPGDNSDIIDGGDGSDRLLFNGANANEVVSLLAVSPGVAMLTRDVGNITMTLMNTEQVDLGLIGGTDTYTGGTGLAATGLTHVTVDGGAGADTLNGGDIAETLDGGADVDTVNGGGGDDTLNYSPLQPGDTLNGGPGTDTLAVAGTNEPEAFGLDATPGQISLVTVAPYATVPAQIAAGIEHLRLDALGGSDTLSLTLPAQNLVTVDADGGDGNDALQGSNGNDILRGGAGDDQLFGFAGDDQLFGDAGQDVLIGGDGADAFHCGGLGDLFDATGADTVDADCVPPPPPPLPAPPPVVTPPAPVVTLPAPVIVPPQSGPPVKGFAIVRVAATLSSLKVTLRNTTAAKLTVRVSAVEHGHSSRAVTKSLAAHATATVTVAVPASVRSLLRKALRHASKTTRRLTITITNTATHATTTTSRTLTLKR